MHVFVYALHKSKEIFLHARRYASGTCRHRVSVRLSVSPSIRLSQVGVLLRWLNSGSRKQRHTIAQ